QFKLAVTTRHVAAEHVARVWIERVGIKGDAAGAGRGDGPTGKIQRQLEARVKVESLHDRRRDDRIAADVVHKLHLIFNRLFPTHAIRRATKRKIQRQVFQKTHDRGSLVDADTRQLANTNTRVRQRGDLCAREEVEAVLGGIFVDEDLRSLFRRDCLLNVVREDLPESEVRSDVNVSDSDEAVLEIMNAVDIKTRPALIRMLGVSRWSKDSILDRVETDVEIRARVRAYTQIAAKAEAPRSVDVAAKREVSGAAEGLIIRRRQTRALSG